MNKTWQAIPDREQKKEEMYQDTTEYKLIYIYWIDDNAHKGLLKIGDASLKSSKTFDSFPVNCTELNRAAKKRIGRQTGTAGIMYHLCHTEIAVKKKGQYLEAFRDKAVHKILENSGIKRVIIPIPGAKATEWFQVDLDTARNAITACKQGRKTLLSSEIVPEEEREIVLREEQEDAIKKTIACFKNNNQMLWNAKMRYGKTATSLTFVKRELSKYSKTIIITHRPVVESGWHEDFNIVFKKHECLFLTKDKESDNTDDSPLVDLANEKQLKKAQNDGKPFIYFASIQDLRGSKRVGGKFNKNNAVFDLDWDLIINDEAHEGTQTDLGRKVSEVLKKNNTKLLSLSGTPFNIINQFDDDSVYTWDYPMEQSKKRDWDFLHPGDPNPYADLPQMHIYTYDLGDIIKGYSLELEDKAFNFTEFFRTWTGDAFNDEKALPSDAAIGEFIHKNDVRHFLDLISTTSEDSAYPFSTPQYRNMFHHTLWMVPGVKEAQALEAMLMEHPIFKNFKVANVAGEGDYYEDTHYDNALEKVKTAIKDNDYTITLSCGKLTTGVTVREWTACFMLSGSYSTGASSYLQTIFRVQSPGQINGKIKEHSYVFDFAPDRTLVVLAEAAKVSRKGGSGGNRSDDKNRQAMKNFLNFCPVVSIKGTMMKPYSVDSMMEQLKKVYADRAIRTGFDDVSIYNERLLTLDKLDIEEFEKLKNIIGASKAQKLDRKVVMNDQGFTQEEYEKQRKLKKKPKPELTEEEKEELARLKKQKKERGKAVSILRGISVRMPLLIYGADVPFEEDINIDRFVDIVDDESWKEFMPDKVTKDLFQKFTKYYDRDVFIAAGKEIRRLSKKADAMLTTKRVQSITKLFSYFKNPDKETVLTPWRVVNMHLSEALGGYDFYNEDHSAFVDNPRFVDKGEITKETLSNTNSKILEINSKSGLYPLFVTYSIYKTKCNNYSKEELSLEKQNKLWIDTVQENVYVICKTPMAKQITKRTLVGYKDVEINAHYFDDLINMLKNKPDKFINKILKPNYWKKEGTENMKFDAIVGNPPYQGINHQQIYPFFYLTSIKLADYVSLIFPIGWQAPKKANNLSKLNKKEIKEDKQIVFIDNRQNIFVGISGAEWTNIILWGKNYDNKLNGYQKIYTNGSNPQFIKLLCQANENKPKEIKELKAIIDKIDIIPLSKFTSSRKPYGLDTDIIKDNKKYNLPPLYNQKINGDDIKIYCKNEIIKYVPKNYPFPRKGAIDKYKIFVPYAWGNMSEETGLGGAFSNIILAFPNEACTETYLESMNFDNINIAKKHAKYLMSKFCRACLYINKNSQHSTTAWGDVPLQSYSEIWWNKSIIEIDEELFKKYKLPDYLRNYIRENFQARSESNIINYE